METLLLGSASVLRLMVPLVSSVLAAASAAAAAAAAHRMSSFFRLGWWPLVKPRWRSSWWRLNLGREEALSWWRCCCWWWCCCDCWWWWGGAASAAGGAGADAELSVDLFGEQVLRERIIHEGWREEEERGREGRPAREKLNVRR